MCKGLGPPIILPNNNRREYFTSASGLFAVFSWPLVPQEVAQPMVSFPVNDENTVSSSVPGRDKGEADVVRASPPESLNVLFPVQVRVLGRLERDPEAGTPSCCFAPH